MTELSTQDNSIRFCLPTTIAPKYIPQTSPLISLDDEPYENPTYTSKDTYLMELTVHATMQSPVTNVNSPSHQIKQSVLKDGYAWQVSVSLADKLTYLNKDFVLGILRAYPPLSLNTSQQQQRKLQEVKNLSIKEVNTIYSVDRKVECVLCSNAIFLAVF